VFPVGGSEGEEAGGLEGEAGRLGPAGGEEGGERAQVWFVADDGEVGARGEVGEEAGDFLGVVFGLEVGFADEHDGLAGGLGVLCEEGSGLAGAAEWAVPDGGGREAISAETGGESGHIGATARAERAGGILVGGEGVAVADQVEQHWGKAEWGLRSAEWMRRSAGKFFSFLLIFLFLYPGW